MRHDVEIDRAHIEAVFAKYEAQPQAEYIGKDDPPPAGEATGAGWRVECDIIGDVIFSHLCPGWQVPPEKQAEFKQRLAVVFDRWFPGGVGLSDNWGPFPQLLFSVGGIVVGSGFDFKTLQLRPLKVIDPGEAGPAERVQTPGATAGGAPGRYSTVVTDEQ